MLESIDPTFEFVNYYGNTSLFALDVLRRHGRLSDLKLLSVACLMPHLANYLAVFDTVHHNSMTDTRLPVPADQTPAKLVLHRQDLFDLPRLEVDCVISHAALHCLNDTRYGNANSAAGWAKPYRAAAKLREVAGRPVPAVVSVAVHRDEGFFDNNAHLGHAAFVRSFEAAGFALRDHFFDYVCGGIAQRPEYLDPAYRRSKDLPPAPPANPREWVVGNYYFA
jgi:hypothetical protein